MKHTIMILLIIISPVLSFSQITFTRHILEDNFPQTMSVGSYDIDGDGDEDVLGCSYGLNSCCWWENQGSGNFAKHTIAMISTPRVICADDFDGDGYGDIVATSYGNSSIYLWLNDGDNNFTEYIVSNDFALAHTVCIEDLDRDGDKDILASSYCSIGISWFENNGEYQFEEHIVSQGGDNYPCVYAADIDGDNDTDILGTLFGNGRISWWCNDGDNNYSERIITVDFPGAHWTHANDLDGDGDMDVLGASYTNSKISWWENDGEEYFTEHVLGDMFYGATSVWSDDFDGDGDMDVFGAAEEADEVRWWTNLGNGGFEEHIICGDFDGASHVHVADIDNDGDKDVMCAGRFEGSIAWWANDTFQFAIDASPLTGNFPLDVQFSEMCNADWPITQWAWDFQGDGSVDSYDQHPSFTYNTHGDYSVYLTVGDGFHNREILYHEYIHVFDGFSALEFDGMESYAGCDGSGENNMTGELTLEAWIKPYGWGENSSNGLGKIIEKEKFSLYLITENLSLNDNSLVFQIKDSTGRTSVINTEAYSINLNRWQHIAAIYSANGDVSIFIDDNEQELDYMNHPTGGIEDNSGFDLLIGNSYNRARSFEGVIDEVRIWDIARSREDIQAAMNCRLSGSETGLRVYWPLDEGNGELIADESGGGNDGEIYLANWLQGINLNPTGVSETIENVLPDDISALYAYPNPFNAATIIKFNLKKSMPVNLDIYDIQGRKIYDVFVDETRPGENQISWNAEKLASGIYLYRLTAGELSQSKKLVLIK